MNNNPRPLEGEGFDSIPFRIKIREGGKRNPPYPLFPTAGGAKAAARGGLSSKLFIIFWWFIAANFELGVISLKLDAHTKRTNELTEREKRREKETHFTVNGAFLGKNLNKDIEIHFMKMYLTFFKSCGQQKHTWMIKEVSTTDHQNWSFVIPAKGSQVWNAMVISVNLENHTYKYIANLVFSIQKYIHIIQELIFLAKHYCHISMGSPRNFLSLLCVFCNFVDYLKEKITKRKLKLFRG